MSLGRVIAGIATLGISEAFQDNKGPSSPSPSPLPQSPTPVASSEKATENIKKRKAAGSQSIYTSPLGISGMANIARKTLLGQ